MCSTATSLIPHSAPGESTLANYMDGTRLWLERAFAVQILTWSAYLEDSNRLGNSQTSTSIYDIGSGEAGDTVVTNTNHDMFCPGISILGNGDLVVTGVHCHAVL